MAAPSRLPRFQTRHKAFGFLLKVGSMTESLGVYVPATVCRQILGLGRMLLFMHLLREVGYGLWGLGVVIFTMASSLVTLGSHHGLIRYVSFYEARGQLGAFYRRMRWRVLACAVLLSVAALAGSNVIVFLARSGASAVDYHPICWAALANAALLAIYHNMVGFLVGMRLYRAVSALEVSFSVVFTALGAAALLVAPSVVVLLGAHFIALAAVFVAGMILLHRAIRSLPEGAAAGEQLPGAKKAPVPEPHSDSADEVPERPIRGVESEAAAAAPVSAGAAAAGIGGLGRVLRFGFVAALAGFLWQGAGYVSFLLTSRRYGEAGAGVFFAFLPLGQAMMVLANAARAVIFTHVARLWESGERRPAVFVLETAYKALTLGTMTLSILLYVTSPLWVLVLPQGFRGGLALLGGLLMFFQASIHLTLLNSLARLHERPVIIALGPLVGAGLIVILALWWMGLWGPVGAARAAGAGMYVGMMAVSLTYLLVCRVRLGRSTYFAMAAPVVLLLPPPVMGVAWVVVLAAAGFTGWMFDARQKRILKSSVGRIIKTVRLARRGPSGGTGGP